LKILLPTEIRHLQSYIPRFIAIVGLKAWNKREAKLLSLVTSDPFQAKVVQHYHWLELELARLRQAKKRSGHLSARMESVATLSALHFVGASVELYQSLESAAKKEFQGRLRDGLKATSGFAPVYLELMHAFQFSMRGYDVSFPDMEHSGRHDLTLKNSSVTFEVECKHISVDAGRKIHQKDFYRLMTTMIDLLSDEIPLHSSRSILLVTLEDRLPTSDRGQEKIADEIRNLANQPIGTRMDFDGFKIAHLSQVGELGLAKITDEADLQKRVQNRFGESCHMVATGNSERGLAIIIRSRNEDDHSKPQLDAMKYACKQLSGDQPAFISIQFDDMNFSQLQLPHVKRRMNVLSQYLFASRESHYLAATIFSAYQPTMRLGSDEMWNPVSVFWNDKFKDEWRESLPFQEGMKDDYVAYISAATKPRPALAEEFNKSPSSAAWRRRRAKLK